MGIKKTTYYKWLKGEEDKDKEIKEEIVRIYNNSERRYGYRKMTKALREEGYIIDHKKVYRLMKLLNISGK